MSRVRWSARADADFLALIAYLREAHRPAAKRGSLEIRHLARRLGPLPELGRVGRLAGTRELSAPDWNKVLVYRIDDQGVEIITLRDTRMQNRDES